jgi:hypothetical protein
LGHASRRGARKSIQFVSASSDGAPIRTEKSPVMTKANSSMVGKPELI